MMSMFIINCDMVGVLTGTSRGSRVMENPEVLLTETFSFALTEPIEVSFSVELHNLRARLVSY